jgi:phage shock protein PspC (stress-responsive transcriptional regulator)
MAGLADLRKDSDVADRSTSELSTALRRDTSNSVWAGVAAGVARRLDLAPWIVRVAFTIGTLFGGVGLILYVAGWVLIPADGEDDALIERWIRDGDGTNWLGVVLIGIAVVTLLGSVQFLDGEVVFAAALLVVGVLLYRGTFDDRPASSDPAEPRPVPAATQTEGAEIWQSEPDGADGSRVDPTAGAVADDLDDDAILAAAGITPTIEPVVGDEGSRVMGSQPRVGAPRSVRPRSILGRVTVAAMMIVLGALAVADNWFAGVTVTEYLAAAVLVIGAGQLVASRWGRSRATIVLGLVLITAMQATSAFTVPFTGGFGDPTYTVASVDDLADEYRLMAGEMTIDLRLLRFSGEQRLEASVAAGHLVVLLPSETSVQIRTSVIGGELNVLGSVDSGVDVDLERGIVVEGADSTLILDLEVGFGQIDVERG